jgi:hypothetical protein
MEYIFIIKLVGMRNIVIFLQKLDQNLKSLTLQDSWEYTILRTEGV